MAGDWIKMRGNLWDDPRVAKLCDLTDQSEAAIVGGLYWLWATADQHSEDGIMPGLTLRQIDRKTGVQGLGEALVSIGWLADHPEGVRIVRFEEHNGASAKKRCQNAKRVANHRAGNDDVTHEALQDEHKTATPALAREEKRREEITPTTDVVGESAPKPRPARKCPEGFEVTPAMQDWATINAPLVNLDQATATFRDHTFKTAITDWAGAWRNWMRREQQYTTDRQRPGARPVVNRQEAIEQRNRAVGDEWLRQQEALDASQ